MAFVIERAIEIRPLAIHFDEGFLDVPAPAPEAVVVLTQSVREQRSKARFPCPYRFMGKDKGIVKLVNHSPAAHQYVVVKILAHVKDECSLTNCEMNDGEIRL